MIGVFGKGDNTFYSYENYTASILHDGNKRKRQMRDSLAQLGLHLASQHRTCLLARSL